MVEKNQSLKIKFDYVVQKKLPYLNSRGGGGIAQLVERSPTNSAVQGSRVHIPVKTNKSRLRISSFFSQLVNQRYVKHILIVEIGT